MDRRLNGANMDFESLLRTAVKNNVSDVHIQAQSPPMVRINGKIRTVDMPTLENEQILGFIATMSRRTDRDAIQAALVEGFDFCHKAEGVGRFRCSAYRQQGHFGIVMRVIKTEAPSLEELNKYICTGEAGMQSFDQHILQMYQDQRISGKEAMRWATNPEAFAMSMRGFKSAS